MAKTKHQKLADRMRNILSSLDEFTLKVKRQLDLVQLHFYEPYLLVGRPLMQKFALRRMFLTHYINLQRLATNRDLSQTCQKYPMLGTIISCPFYRHANSKQPSEKGRWMVPWKVNLVCPDENQDKLARSRSQALLYCPNPDEISNEIDWFEKDMAADSFTHQLLSIQEYYLQREIVRQNFLKDSFSIWTKSKDAWLTDPAEESDPNQQYDVALNPRSVDEANFAPKKGDSLDLAYESVMKSIRARSCRHRAPLLQIYKRNLEEALFEGVPWNSREKKSFLQKWKDNFFGTEQPKKSKKTGRWKQCEGIDDITASWFIDYFVSKFIADSKNKKLGDIACVLWILLWIAQEEESNRITIKQVLQLKSKDIVADDAAIIVNDREVTISWGLRELLLCLQGDGKGKRSCRLFKNLDISGKALERAMIDASREILPDKDDPVLPGAFLVSPHVYPGIRMAPAERTMMRKAKPLVPHRYSRREIKRAFLDAQEHIRFRSEPS